MHALLGAFYLLICHEEGKFNNHLASEAVIKWNFDAVILPWLKSIKPDDRVAMARPRA